MTEHIDHEPIMRANLLKMADAYAKASGNGITTVSYYAWKNANFFSDLRAQKPGRSGFTIRKYDDAMRWFRSHWPVDAECPAIVEFPRVDSAPVAPAQITPSRRLRRRTAVRA